MKGAQIFVECLKRERVEVIFGYPGGAVGVIIISALRIRGISAAEGK
jgi:thiamine pyrophosphate-dependent acetolactate synthase large subunit-like protein